MLLCVKLLNLPVLDPMLFLTQVSSLTQQVLATSGDKRQDMNACR